MEQTRAMTVTLPAVTGLVPSSQALEGDRLPWPTAMLIILGLSLLFWGALLAAFVAIFR